MREIFSKPSRKEKKKQEIKSAPSVESLGEPGELRFYLSALDHLIKTSNFHFDLSKKEISPDLFNWLDRIRNNVNQIFFVDYKEKGRRVDLFLKNEQEIIEDFLYKCESYLENENFIQAEIISKAIENQCSEMIEYVKQKYLFDQIDGNF